MPPVIHDFVPRSWMDDLIEVQVLDGGHPVRRMGLHGHTFCELILVTDGCGRHRVNDRWYRVVPGQLFVIAPGDVHDCAELASVRGWLLLFAPHALSPHGLGAPGGAATDDPLLRCFAQPGKSRPSVVDLSAEECTAWARALGALADELAVRRPLHRRAVDATVRLLLVELARRLPVDDADRGSGHAGHIAVDRALRFIDAHYLEDIAARDVAAAVGRTSAHLTTTLREHTGRTLTEWIVERRMGEARRLLVRTDESVAGIAERVRYGDVSAFARAFRRIHRIAPGAWRRLHR